MLNNVRILHFVFKIGDRTLTSHFFRNVLGMKILRHEEFTEGCDAACNGPYDNRWSKTMVGYGPEDKNFVIELTYNYPVKSYKQGNDFIGITISKSGILDRAKQHKWPILENNILEAPGGYKFCIIDKDLPSDTECLTKVTLASTNLNRTIKYWHELLGFKIHSQKEKSVLFNYDETQTKLEFVKIDAPIDRASAYGRIAFAIPYDDQPKLDEAIAAAKEKVLVPLVKLDTPDKASVRVIILADPDGHEICFVDCEGFDKLSQFDSEAEGALDKYIKKDKS